MRLLRRMGPFSPVEGDGGAKIAGEFAASGESGLGGFQRADVQSAASFHHAAKGGAGSLLPGLELTDGSAGLRGAGAHPGDSSYMLPGANPSASIDSFSLSPDFSSGAMLPGADPGSPATIDLSAGTHMLPGTENMLATGVDLSAGTHMLPGADSVTSAFDMVGSASFELDCPSPSGHETTHTLVNESPGAATSPGSGATDSFASGTGLDAASGNTPTDVGIGSAGAGASPPADLGAGIGGAGGDLSGVAPGADLGSVSAGMPGMESITGSLGDIFSQMSMMGNPMGLLTGLFQFLMNLFCTQGMNNLGHMAQLAEANMLELAKMKMRGG